MIGNLKLLGLALIAVLAMSVATASMASADTSMTESAPAKLTGSQQGSANFTTTFGNTVCKEAKYTGTTTTGVTTFTVTPSYPEKTVIGEQNCTTAGLPSLIHTNGCTYLFHIGAVTGGTMDIVCSAGKEITVTAGYNITIKCTVHVPAQTGLSNVEYRNTGFGATRELIVEMGITNLKYSHTKGSGIGACTAGSGTTGSAVGNVLITAEKDNESTEHVGIFLT